MMKIVLILLLLLCSTPVFARFIFDSCDDVVNCEKRVVGTVKELRLNTIVIYDEKEKISRSLIDVAPHDDIRVGDRLVIYFSLANNVVKTIKKAEPIKPPTKGQNNGLF